MDGGIDTGTDASPGDKALVSFAFLKAHNPSMSTDAIGTITGHSVAVNLPDGTDLTSLIATWTTTGHSVSVNGVVQISDVTPNRFTGLVTYVITASDGSTARYTIDAAVATHGFGQAVTFAGMAPLGVALADLDGDGAPDVAAAELGGRGVRLLHNTTAGGATPSFAFTRQLTNSSDQPANDVTSADFNADGKPDLVGAFASNFIIVWLDATPTGVSPPTFADPLTITVGAGPASAAIADFNGDDRPDLAVSNNPAATVSVLLNTTPTGATAPTFSADMQFATGATPISIAIADFDGDGRPDLATSNNNPGSVFILLNIISAGASTPSFATKVDIPVMSLARHVASGDINGDGMPDLVIANNDDSSVSVLLNTTPTGSTTPTFAGAVRFATSTCPFSVIASDLDVDGKPDLVVVDNCSSQVSVLFNVTPAGAQTPMFQAHIDLATGPDPVAITIGDVNGDGRRDLVVAASGNGSDPGGVSVLLGHQ